MTRMNGWTMRAILEWKSMGVISVEEWKNEEKSGGECWNEEEGGSLSV